MYLVPGGAARRDRGPEQKGAQEARARVSAAKRTLAAEHRSAIEPKRRAVQREPDTWIPGGGSQSVFMALFHILLTTVCRFTGERTISLLLSPVRRRLAVQHARDKGVTERHACRLVGQWRTTQRYQPTQSNDEDRLTQSIVALASQYGRFGYRRITALLKQAGWKVGKDRVQRIWRREGLKVPAKHKPRGRLWLNDGSCIRLRPERRNHVWSYDFVEARTHDGRSLRLLVMIDEFTRECLAIRVARRLNSAHVIELLGDCMLEYGVPEYVRSDNGAEMTARRVKQWLASVGTKPLFIEPGSPWENGYCESFNGKFRDECLNGEIFYSLKEAQVVIEQWRKFYNEVRPHSSLGYRAPAPVAWIAAA